MAAAVKPATSSSYRRLVVVRHEIIIVEASIKCGHDTLLYSLVMRRPYIYILFFNIALWHYFRKSCAVSANAIAEYNIL